MRIGFIGLGRMGANMVRRLLRDEHQIVAYNRTPEKTKEIEGEGAEAAYSIAELVSKLEKPRAVWIMVPAGDATEAQIEELLEHLEPGDTIIDGGNTNFHDDVRRHAALKEKGIGYVDAGTSGGIWGLQVGYALMVGGEDDAVAKVQPAFDTLKPSEGGFVHAGKVGAGHFAKMVHNGIEYGIMQAYGEGYELLETSDLVTRVPEIFRSWTQGTVIRSWLLDLLVRALEEDPELKKIRGWAEDSGEGRWTLQAAIEHAVPMPVIAAALFARFSSRQQDSPAMKVVAALRNQFGGHATRAEDEPAPGVTPEGNYPAPPAPGT